MGDGPPPSSGWQERLDSERDKAYSVPQEKTGFGDFVLAAFSYTMASAFIIFIMALIVAAILVVAAISALAGDVIGLWDVGL